MKRYTVYRPSGTSLIVHADRHEISNTGALQFYTKEHHTMVALFPVWEGFTAELTPLDSSQAEARKYAISLEAWSGTTTIVVTLTQDRLRFLENLQHLFSLYARHKGMPSMSITTCVAERAPEEPSS